MAQSIASWEYHLPHLAKHRSVLIYETLGQGPPPPSEVCSVDGKELSLQHYYGNVSLERQGLDFWNVVKEAFFSPGYHYYEQQQKNQNNNNNNKISGSDEEGINNNNDNNNGMVMMVDVASFSFGARVAMAAASIEPNGIRRLHLTGVGAERDNFANVILASWKDMLGCSDSIDDDDNDNDEECDPTNHAKKCTARLRSFAWSVILATYSEEFLASVGSERVSTWVDGVCRYNTEEGLRAILVQTHGNDDGRGRGRGGKEDEEEEDPWSPAAMARRIRSSGAVKRCRIVVGSRDKMSHPTQALRLAEMLGGDDDDDDDDDGVTSEAGRCVLKVMEGCGHAVPMEAMRLWRGDVLGFLDE